MRGFARSQEKIISYLRVFLKYLSISRKSITRFCFLQVKIRRQAAGDLSYSTVDALTNRVASRAGRAGKLYSPSSSVVAFATDDGKNLPRG